MSYYETTVILPDVYRITSPEHIYSELIVGTEKALLLDTGWGGGDLPETVRMLTDKPLILVNSHGHVDHINGNYRFDLPSHLHPEDRELFAAHSSEAMRRYIVDTAGALFPSDFDPAAYLAGRTAEPVPVTEGQVFDLGGKTLEVVALPGHTRGSIGLLYREAQLLYVGDAIGSCLLLYLPESTDLSTYISTLEKAIQLPFRRLVMSHRANLSDRDVLDLYLRTAREADWETAAPYRADAPDVRVVFAPGTTMENLEDPTSACIVISKDHFK